MTTLEWPRSAPDPDLAPEPEAIELAPAAPEPTATTPEPATWVERNQRHLVRELQRIRACLVARVEGDAVTQRRPLADPSSDGRTTRDRGRDRPDAAPSPAPGDRPMALERLGELLGLSPFERDVVLLCAGVELDAGFAALVGEVQGGPGPAPTFGLALAALPGAFWAALGPDAPLRAWRLVELAGPGLTTAALRIDERVLHFLAGVASLDERVAAVMATPQPAGEAGPRIEDAAGRVLAELGASPPPAAIQLTGGDAEARAAVVETVRLELAIEGLALDAAAIPSAAPDARALARLVAREALLGERLISVSIGELASPEPADHPARVAAFVREIGLPVVVTAEEPVAALATAGPLVEVAALTADERLVAWRTALATTVGPAAADGAAPALPAIVAQFELTGPAIRSVVIRTAPALAATPERAAEILWTACRLATRPRLDGLAQRIEAVAGWDDLVVPEAQQRVLRAVVRQVRHRHLVHEGWGFAARGDRGLGITALFAGPSGTGKTMAAEVLARELELDLYRIDLASVVSKYIGETEKNLKRLFDAAEGSGAILLFDEADALFGKRSEVRDSHDRYANIEVSYLLQRMEAYRGLAILTTNQREALDPAFLRRIRFVVGFPFPDAELRAAIWRGIFPPETPLRPLDHARLAQLSVTGGHIRNIALAGAFLAAERGSAVGMADLAEAARAEYAKLERPLTDAETRGWT